MKNSKRNVVSSAQNVMLRIADAIEDAPYEFESARVIDVKLAASCSEDFDPNVMGTETGSKKHE